MKVLEWKDIDPVFECIQSGYDCRVRNEQFGHDLDQSIDIA